MSTLRVRFNPQDHPAQFARRVILKAVREGAEEIVVEKNLGFSDSVAAVFGGVMTDLDQEGLLPGHRKPLVRAVYASRGSGTRGGQGSP